MTDNKTSNPHSKASQSASAMNANRTTSLRRGLLIALTLVLALGVVGTVGGSALSQWTGYGPPWRHHGGFGGPFDPAAAEDRADRAIRHFVVEIDATADQQEKLRSIVRAAVRDLLPMRERVSVTRQRARDLLTQTTIDRDAIERLRAEQVEAFDAASRRFAQALADVTEVLTPEQRRRVSDLMATHWSSRRR
jgi:periplasmic protein CpxP/Spy